MALPAYISSLDIYGTGTAVDVAVLDAAGPKVLVWSELDADAKADLDKLVVANGGALPFGTGMAVPNAYMMPNGYSFSYTYGYVVRDQAAEAARRALIRKNYWFQV
jgi:hypothetical protein